MGRIVRGIGREATGDDRVARGDTMNLLRTAPGSAISFFYYLVNQVTGAGDVPVHGHGHGPSPIAPPPESDRGVATDKASGETTLAR